MSDQAVSNNKQEPLVKAVLQFSASKLEAFITINPDASGVRLSLEYLKELLEKNNVVNGVDSETLTKLAVNPTCSTPVLVARGTKSGEGIDAKLHYNFERHRSIAPKTKEDGTVDFKNLGIIQSVSKGDVLVVKRPRVDGAPGLNVCGEEIPPKPAKDITIPAGRNVVLSEDRLKLFADIDGQVVFANDRVSVLTLFEVDGDVSVSTGNINFVGNVFIKGNVQAGFSVNASGNIEVNGVVEGAVLKAGGDIIIRNGFNGGDKGSLTADGDIASKFIQAGNVTVKGNLETTYIYNSNVRCGNTVNMIGKGVIIGGCVRARKRVNANTIGGENSTKTVIEVGNDPEAIKRMHELAEEIPACGKNILAIESAVVSLNKLKSMGKLPAGKEDSLTKSESVLEQLKKTMEALEAEKIIIDEKIASIGKGYVAVKNIAFPGVDIAMGSEHKILTSKFSHTLFSRDEGYIKSGPL